MRLRLAQLPDPPDHTHLGRDDWLGAFGVFLLVFLSTCPVVIPFLLMQNVEAALRLSNGIAILMLFLCGYAYGKCVERRPWLMGMCMVVLGSVLVGLTIVLGG